MTIRISVAASLLAPTLAACGEGIPTEEDCDRLQRSQERQAASGAADLHEVLNQVLEDNRVTQREQRQLQAANQKLEGDLQPVGCE